MTRQKINELQHLIDFLRAAGIEPEGIEVSECPDFILTIDGKTVGVELTVAQQPSGQFGALQIEHAQSEYAKALRNIVEQKSDDESDGVIIGVSFEDGIAVTSKDRAGLSGIADLIIRHAGNLPNPGAITIWSEKWAKIRERANMSSERDQQLSAPLPDFIQNICLYRDGKHDIKLTSGRGGITIDFEDDVLLPILEKKNKRLKKYKACDLTWLVIVTSVGHIEDHNPQRERANVLLSSFATTFGSVNITHPIPSDFDETFLFKWPTRVVVL